MKYPVFILSSQKHKLFLINITAGAWASRSASLETTGDPFIQTIHYLLFPYIVKKWSTKHKEGLPTLLPQEQAGNFTSSRPL